MFFSSDSEYSATLFALSLVKWREVRFIDNDNDLSRDWRQNIEKNALSFCCLANLLDSLVLWSTHSLVRVGKKLHAFQQWSRKGVFLLLIMINNKNSSRLSQSCKKCLRRRCLHRLSRHSSHPWYSVISIVDIFLNHRTLLWFSKSSHFPSFYHHQIFSSRNTWMWPKSLRLSMGQCLISSFNKQTMQTSSRNHAVLVCFCSELTGQHTASSIWKQKADSLRMNSPL